MNLVTLLPLQTHIYLTTALLMLVPVFQYPMIFFQIKFINPTSNIFEMLDFNRCDWSQLAESLRNLDWAHELCKVPPEMLLPFATGIIADKCMTFVKKTW